VTARTPSPPDAFAAGRLRRRDAFAAGTPSPPGRLAAGGVAADRLAATAGSGDLNTAAGFATRKWATIGGQGRPRPF